MNNKARIIAFYLPQFHPIPENNEWWGEGFTEWTNVGKAKPLFKGHNQPRVPADLGYYDLRLPIIRQQQASMAQDAGIEGFCYWHYWFGNGKRLMADIFDEVLNSGKPDFPFCLGWANHSWYSKNWNSDGTSVNRLLIEQTYPGLGDAQKHFRYLLKAFKDPRYIKVDGRPFLLIFDPISLPQDYLRNFKDWAKEAGFKDLYLVANIVNAKVSKEELLNVGYDAVVYQRLGACFSNSRAIRLVDKYSRLIKGFITRRPPNIIDYSKYYHQLVTDEDYELNVIPSIVPQWDHTPRSGWNGSLFINSTPDVFYKHVKDALKCVEFKPDEQKIILLKSWNEWGEGNYIEPDLTHGRGYLEALKYAINE